MAKMKKVWTELWVKNNGDMVSKRHYAAYTKADGTEVEARNEDRVMHPDGIAYRPASVDEKFITYFVPSYVPSEEED